MRRLLVGIAAIGILSSGITRAADRFAVLLGGSGENEADNFLIQDLRDVAGRLSSRGWKVVVAAGAKDGLVGPTSVKGSNLNILRVLRETQAKANPGDQWLTIIHSHGRARESEWGQQSHSIVSEDIDSGGTDPGFDLDPLGGVLDQASSRGVRVGLADLSCYSGATQSLLKAQASCTVTLAAPGYVSLCSGRPEERHFTSSFLKLPKSGSPATLESQFLSARAADLDSVNLPQISSRSTPAVEAWNDFLQTVDPLDVFEDLKNLRAGPKPFPAEKLISAVKTKSHAAELAKRLNRALAIRAELEKQEPSLADEYDKATVELKLPGRDSFKISPGNLTELLDRDKLEGATDVQRNLLSQLRSARGTEALKASAGVLADFRARKARFDRKADDLAEASGKLLDLEREIYDQLSVPSTDPARAAACGDFGL